MEGRRIIDRKQQTVRVKVASGSPVGMQTPAVDIIDANFDECVGVKFSLVNEGGLFQYRLGLNVAGITKIDLQSGHGLLIDRSVGVSDRTHPVVFRCPNIKVEIPIETGGDLFADFEVDVVFDLVKYENR